MSPNHFPLFILVTILFLFYPNTVASLRNLKSFAYSSPKIQINETFGVMFTQQQSMSIFQKPFVNELWIPTEWFIFDYFTFWIIHPFYMSRYQHVNLCDKANRQSILQFNHLDSCLDFYSQYNTISTELLSNSLTFMTTNGITGNTSAHQYLYLFSMCFYCANEESISFRNSLLENQNSSASFFWRRINSTLFSANCNGYVFDMAITAAPRILQQSFCYCSQNNAYAPHCDSFDLFWVPTFYFGKDVSLLVVNCILFLICGMIIVIPRIYSNIVLVVNIAKQASLTHKEKCNTICKRILFSSKNAIALFGMIVFLCLLLQPILELLSIASISLRLIRPIPRFFAFIFYFCCHIIVLNSWIRSIAVHIKLKEPNALKITRIVFSVVPYIPLGIAFCSIMIVGIATNNFDIVLGVTYLLASCYAAVVSIVSIIAGILLYTFLQKNNKKVNFCKIKFTKYLVMVEITVLCAIIIATHEGIRLIVGPFTGQVLYLYGVYMVDVILIFCTIPIMYSALNYEEMVQCYRSCFRCIPSHEIQRQFFAKRFFFKKDTTPIPSESNTPTDATVVTEFQTTISSI